MRRPHAWLCSGCRAARSGVGPILGLWLFLGGLGPTPAALAWQEPEEDTLTKILAEDMKLEALKKDRLRPPIEFSRSQVMPNDVLPYIKANHWTMMGLEIRANHNNYDGLLQSRPVGLLDQPNEMIYRRDAHLIKGQEARLTLPVLLPVIPKELGFQLVRPEAIRQDEDWPAPLKVLEPHQQMIMILGDEANDSYNRWSTLRAVIPVEIARDDQTLLDKLRYYRVVLPLDPEKPLLSPHPLTWSPISHVIWDGMPPERLGVAQQQAMLDWLHWGGQLVIVGGAGPAFGPLRESFLAPYLPAEPSGANVSRTGAQLAPLSRQYPPLASVIDTSGYTTFNVRSSSRVDAFSRLGRFYKPPAPISTLPDKPIFITALQPRPGATSIPLGGPDDPPLAVESRVGRGRITMLAVALSDPDLARWDGYDTLVRRVVLRRPEEPLVAEAQRQDGRGVEPAHYEMLTGPDLTDVRYVARDLGAPTRKPVEDDATQGYTVNGFGVFSERPEVPSSEWLDAAALPVLARSTLEQASGIEIPSPAFVLKVIIAYLLALVPLNWLVCRYLIGRREWAWVVVPTLSLAFAYGVERAAAYDVGYDSSCDEIDLLETHGDYPRGHLSRFGSIYSTGRVPYTIAYPNDATALALPLATGRSLRGEDKVQSQLRTLPYPALTDLLVQPRSLSLFRAEQMPNLPGTVEFQADDQSATAGTITNKLGFDLADAWVVRVDNSKLPHGRHLGALAQGAAVPLGDLADLALEDEAEKPNTLDPAPFEKLLLRSSQATRPDEVGAIRLVGRVDQLMPGQTIDPPVDRQRGFTLVVAHLKPAPLPDPASKRYNTAITSQAIESGSQP